MTKIAVIGPGAIGGTLTAWLAQVAGNDVTLCARTGFPRLVVEVPEGRTLDVAVPVLTEPSEARAVDWVLTTTKTYQTEGAARWIERLLGPHTRVAVIQNGVEHMNRFADLVPAARTLPVIIDIPAERRAPGQIRQRRHGLIAAPAGELGSAFAALFAGTPLAITLSDDFLTTSWRKLILNSAAAVNAMALKPGGIIRLPKIAALVHAIVEESVTVGLAVGAKVDRALADEAVTRYRQGPADAVSSILADRLAGRPLEIDARNGVIVRTGEKLGVPTPLNRMAVAILEAASEV
jgi:2-dehydropantoate 2-reductase